MQMNNSMNMVNNSVLETDLALLRRNAESIVRAIPAGTKLLPVLKCWPEDGGRFVTLPMVHTLDPDTGVRNVGMYRMQVFDDCTTGMHWHVHKTGARHYDGYRRQGRRMPVAVALGGDPAYTYAATTWTNTCWRDSCAGVPWSWCAV